jgi:general secretion pathway protein D
MNKLKIVAASSALAVLMFACASYNAFTKARTAEKVNDWDQAVIEYQKALEIEPDNIQFRMALQHAKLEASRVHFEKGKSLRTAAATATGQEQYRLAQLAATELQLTVKLDPTNQYAAVELGKVVQIVNDAEHAADRNSIEERKKRAKAAISKTRPPQLNPASDQPISLSFPRETPVKDIYKALGNAFGINIMFDQAVKDDRISIELKDVTAQQALERVMQAASHFYKVLDEHTIIIIPDNPQARRDYEDLVIRTFYLSNGDAEQVTNVVRTMIEARNVFPLKALNAITIRDTTDKVMIAEKIIEANDKAKAEVVVDVELLQLDLLKARKIGAQFTNSFSAAYLGPDGNPVKNLTLDQFRTLSAQGPDPFKADGKTPNDPGIRNSGLLPTPALLNFTVPSMTYDFMKSATDSELLANPELRISEGEKATLHIGQRIPVPVSTFNSITTGTGGGAVAPVTSFQYQDVGIKVSIEPRVHHNREVTLKLTVEVSNVGGSVSAGEGQPSQPIIATRTIESTIRLKDGETNFLAGLIQRNENTSTDKIPILGEIPIIGRLLSHEDKQHTSTDLVLTMTPHIVRIPDITDDDMAPMWVGTQNNLSFRGVSPRIEAAGSADPFSVPVAPQNIGRQLAPDGEPGNYIIPDANNPAPVKPGRSGVQGSAPTDIFNKPPVNPNNPPPPPQPQNPELGSLDTTTKTPSTKLAAVTTSVEKADDQPSMAQLRLAPRLAPQPASIDLKPGEEKVWNVVGMDVDGLQADSITMHFDPNALYVEDVTFGSAIVVDPKTPPIARIDRDKGLITLMSTTGKPLVFRAGGNVADIRVHGGITGNTVLVLDNPNLHNAAGAAIESAISGGRAKVE